MFLVVWSLLAGLGMLTFLKSCLGPVEVSAVLGRVGLGTVVSQHDFRCSPVPSLV